MNAAAKLITRKNMSISYQFFKCCVACRFQTCPYSTSFWSINVFISWHKGIPRVKPNGCFRSDNTHALKVHTTKSKRQSYNKCPLSIVGPTLRNPLHCFKKLSQSVDISMITKPLLWNVQWDLFVRTCTVWMYLIVLVWESNLHLCFTCDWKGYYFITLKMCIAWQVYLVTFAIKF